MKKEINLLLPHYMNLPFLYVNAFDWNYDIIICSYIYSETKVGHSKSIMWPTNPWQWYTVWQVKCSLCGIIGKKSTTDSFPFFNFRNSIKVREIFGCIHVWYFVQTNTSIVLECWISSETIDYMIKMINIIINYWSTHVHFLRTSITN